MIEEIISWNGNHWLEYMITSNIPMGMFHSHLSSWEFKTRQSMKIIHSWESIKLGNFLKLVTILFLTACSME